MQNGSGLALASNRARALVVMPFGERLVAAPRQLRFAIPFFYQIWYFQAARQSRHRATLHEFFW